MAPSTTETPSDITGGQVSTSRLLSVISEGLTTLQPWTPNTNNTPLPDVIEAVTSALPSDMSSDVTSIPPMITTQRGFIVDVTSDVMTQGGDNVISGLMTGIMTTEGPGFTLSPMLKWFIATGTVIVLVFILIIINCCLSYKDKLQKTVKDVKHYAAEEKRVRREQSQINNMEDPRGNKRQTHVFFSWIGSSKGKNQHTN